MKHLIALFDLSEPAPGGDVWARLERPSSALGSVLTVLGGAGVVLLLYVIGTVTS